MTDDRWMMVLKVVVGGLEWVGNKGKGIREQYTRQIVVTCN
jgi:hypothetical protein